MQLGLVFTIGTELLFGFSQNFGWAVSARFMWGMLNGNLGVAKTYISEVLYVPAGLNPKPHIVVRWQICDLYFCLLPI